MSTVMYGVGVSVPDIPWPARPESPLPVGDLLTSLNLNGATRAELDALTKRVEALEHALIRRMATKASGAKRRKKGRR